MLSDWLVSVSEGESIDSWKYSYNWHVNIGFDFNAIKDSKSEWVLKYNGFIKQMAHPLYMMFPILEKRFLWLFPKRKRAHDDMSAFLDMLDSVIEYKRQVLKGQDSLQKEHEKDLLTLMIESENKGEGALTNEQLKVSTL